MVDSANVGCLCSVIHMNDVYDMSFTVAALSESCVPVIGSDVVEV